MTDEFESILQKLKWPEAASEPTKEWKDCFEKLLDLQDPELREVEEPIILLPMGVLAKTFTQQFKYHFFSDKPTNAASKVCTCLVPVKRLPCANISSSAIIFCHGLLGL